VALPFALPGRRLEAVPDAEGGLGESDPLLGAEVGLLVVGIAIDQLAAHGAEAEVRISGGDVEAEFDEARTAPLILPGERDEINRATTDGEEGLNVADVRVEEVGGGGLVHVGLGARVVGGSEVLLGHFGVGVVELDTGPGDGMLLEGEQAAEGVGVGLDNGSRLGGEGGGRLSDGTPSDVDIVELVKLGVGRAASKCERTQGCENLHVRGLLRD
jgi:hypothetical protein